MRSELMRGVALLGHHERDVAFLRHHDLRTPPMQPERDVTFLGHHERDVSLLRHQKVMSRF